MADLNNFERVIKEDRAARESKQWRGTLLEYLEVVKADPIMTKLAHARIYDLIISIGLHPLSDTDAIALRKVARRDRKFLVAIVELGLEAIAADGAQVALDMHAEHFLEFAP